jgi:nitrate reductase beta subunit
MTYLANLLTAGDEAPVRLALKRLAAMRAYMRSDRIGENPDGTVLESVGLTAAKARAMYELLALARYEDRFVLPTKNRTEQKQLFVDQGVCGYPEGI